MIRVNKLRLVTTAAGAFPVAGPNPHRVGLLLNPPSTGVAYVALGETAALEDGIRMSAGTAVSWIIQFQEPNPWITDAISAFVTAASTTVLYEIVDSPA